MSRYVVPNWLRTGTASTFIVVLLTFLTACGGGSNSTPPPPPAVPTITSVTPNVALVGAAVTITGTNFTGTNALRFNGTTASFTVDNATQITTSVPAGATTGKITVTNASGTGVSPANFTVATTPTITSFTPTSGAVGTSVTINGTSFTGATSVAFNGTAASTFTVNSATQVAATVPTGATTGKISITAPGGSATSAGNFTIAPPPTITSFSPTNGAPGSAVTINGTGFTGATSVVFNGSAATFSVTNATQIAATVPASATTGPISVTAPGGIATSASNFTVNINPANLDLSIDGLYVTQATQDYPNPSVPLVKDRSAWVRVFVKANQTNTAQPQVRVRFVSGATTNTINISSTVSAVPTLVDPNTLTSWDASVPSAWILNGTQVIADVDPLNAIAESNESNNQFTATLDVRTLKPWKITLVPIKTGTRTGVVTSATRTKESWLDFAKRIHPVADAIDIAVRSTMTSSVSSLTSDGGGWGTVLNELQAKRTADGVTDRYYFGAVNVSYTSGVAGYGFEPGTSAIGWDFFPSAQSVLAHEEGHNFGRPHSPSGPPLCGTPDSPDPAYPYPNGIIGVPGWDVFATTGNLKDSSTFFDIMTYCNTVWVSDYVYKKILDYRAASPIGIVVNASVRNATKEGLLIWGRIENGVVTLEPAFRVAFGGELPEAGSYSIEARDMNGALLASLPFHAEEVADLPEGDSARMFSFVLPMTPEAMNVVASLRLASQDGTELTHRVTRASAAEILSSASVADAEGAVEALELPNRVMQFRWDAERYPVLMIRDQKTGEVRGFLRGGQAEIEDAPADLDLQLSDGVRSRRQTHHRVTN
jgi:IPT/TIG domain-containing protein